jgi:hypothetical protein
MRPGFHIVDSLRKSHSIHISASLEGIILIRVNANIKQLLFLNRPEHAPAPSQPDLISFIKSRNQNRTELSEAGQTFTPSGVSILKCWGIL